MKTMKLTAGVCLMLVALIGCKKETQEFTDTPIIESYLKTGEPFAVKVTRQIPFSDGVTYSSDDINSLAIKVTYNNMTHQLVPLGDGQYADSSIAVTEGTIYNLSFSFNKKEVMAYTTIPSKPNGLTQSVSTYTITRFSTSSPPTGAGGFTMPDPLTITWNNTDRSYYLVVVENMETTLDPIVDFGTNTPPANRFKKTPTTTSSIEINSREFQYYGRHRIIVYHVLPDYATLYETTSSNSQNLTNPSTSIINGYGIFTGLSSDTLLVEVKEP